MRPARRIRGWLVPALCAVAFHALAARLPVNGNGTSAPQRPEAVRLTLAPIPPPPAPVEPAPEVVPPPKPRKAVTRPLRKVVTRSPAPTPVPAAPPSAEPEPVEEPLPLEEPEPEPEPEPAQVAEADVPPEQRASDAPPAPVRSREEVFADLQSYGSSVYRSVTSHRRYPAIATRLRQEGKVEVSVRLAPDGALTEPPRIVASSGYPVLDEEVLAMVARAAPFPPLPRGFDRPSAEFRIPVRFQLD